MGRHATESLLAATDRSLDGFLEAVLEPVETDRLPPVLPVLHPSYREVWIPRLGYDDDGYRRAMRAALEAVGAGSGSG